MGIVTRYTGKVLNVCELVVLCNLVLVTFTYWALLIARTQILFMLSSTNTRVAEDKSQAANDFLRLETATVQKIVLNIFVAFCVLFVVNQIIKRATQKKDYSLKITQLIIALVSLISTALATSIIHALLVSIQ